MLGESTLTQTEFDGGKRFYTFNPDIVFTYEPKDKINLFYEVYGQTQTRALQGSGFNFNTGIIYLLKKNITVDLEYSHRISGLLMGFNQYVGAGLAIEF